MTASTLTASPGAPLLRAVAREYLVTFPADAAARLDLEPPDEVATALQVLDASERAEVLRRMNADAAARALLALNTQDAVETLLSADPGDAARWLALCDEQDRERLTQAVPGRAAQQIRDTLEFPPGTAGHMMDAGVVTFRDETTIEAAFSRIRQLRRRVADVLLCDDEGRLTGVVPLQELVGLPLDTSLGRYARRSFATVHAMASRDEVVDLLSRHRLASLPVVDLDNRLLGTIRYGELVLAAQEAAADDLQTMVGAGREERGLSSPLFTVKSRLPWLLINLMTSFAAAAVVGIFDATIARYTALAVLLPIVAGQSGNTGAQALAVTCRALALREIRARHWPPLLFKEASASFANGVVVALVTAVAVLLFSGNSALALIIGISMVISMVLAATAGAMIPVLLTASGRDPATASSIILTTVTDIVGFFSFLGLAKLFIDRLSQ